MAFKGNGRSVAIPAVGVLTVPSKGAGHSFTGRYKLMDSHPISPYAPPIVGDQPAVVTVRSLLGNRHPSIARVLTGRFIPFFLYFHLSSSGLSFSSSRVELCFHPLSFSPPSFLHTGRWNLHPLEQRSPTVHFYRTAEHLFHTDSRHQAVMGNLIWHEYSRLVAITASVCESSFSPLGTHRPTRLTALPSRFCL